MKVIGMNKKNVFTILPLLLMFIFSNAFAQTTGKISGRVIDKGTGEPLMGTNIVVEGTQMGCATDSNGEYFIINMRPGVYNIVASMIGYGAVKMEDIRVSVNSTSTLVFELSQQVIEGEAITVTAELFTIKKDQTSSIRNISSDDIETLPVDDISQIVELQPGVVGSHFRGGRSNEVAYMVDGVMVTEANHRENQMVEVNPSAVEDMEVITGVFNAEYGNAMSGIVNIVTKEGGSKLHGSASVNVGNYFTSHKDIYAGIEDNEIGIQDYKFSLSGPVLTDNLNFIFDGRYFNNPGYLKGINRFSVNDYSNFGNYPNQFISDAYGDSSFVPMNDREEVNLLGKLTLKPFTALKASLIYTLNENKYQNYNHLYSYNPDGMATHHVTSNMIAFHINHMLSRKAFYELKMSYIKYESGQYVFEDILDPGYVHDRYSRITGQWFSTGGQDKNHIKDTEETSRIKFDLTWQIHKNHSLKAGIDAARILLDHNWIDIRNAYEGTDFETMFTTDPNTGKRTYNYYEPEVRSDSSIYTDRYKKKPNQFAAYVQDKMEFHDMVINFGIRFDYFDPNTVYPTNMRNPANQDYYEDESRMSKYPKADPQYQLSPRLGLAYKLGDVALLRFSYGHFMQIPPLDYYYRNNSFTVTELGWVGNPLLKAQKTISYEVGLWYQLTREMNFEVAVFYKDIYDLLSSKMLYTYSTIRFGIYDNKDYGNVRGLELKYQSKIGDNITLNANYTLQYTRGVADTPELAFNRAGQDQDPVNKLIPLEWDQRHTLNIIAGYNTPEYGISLLAVYSSGKPYSWTPITESRLKVISLLPNNQVRPSQFKVDLNAFYNLFTFANIDVRLTLLAYNIFANLNENMVNTTTGRAYTGTVRPIDLSGHRSNFSDYYDVLQNPAMYAAPRSIRIGLEFQF